MFHAILSAQIFFHQNYLQKTSWYSKHTRRVQQPQLVPHPTVGDTMLPSILVLNSNLYTAVSVLDNKKTPNLRWSGVIAEQETAGYDCLWFLNNIWANTNKIKHWVKLLIMWWKCHWYWSEVISVMWFIATTTVCTTYQSAWQLFLWNKWLFFSIYHSFSFCTQKLCSISNWPITVLPCAHVTVRIYLQSQMQCDHKILFFSFFSWLKKISPLNLTIAPFELFGCGESRGDRKILCFLSLSGLHFKLKNPTQFMCS